MMKSYELILKPLLSYTLLIISTASILCSLYISNQSNFSSIALPFLVSFLAYLWIILQKEHSIRFFRSAIALAVLIRILAIFILPQLSDDIYRFIWDGKLLLSGYNPYAWIPSEVLSENLAGVDTALYEQLNSPNYYSVYPPLTQLIFLAGAWTESIYTSSLIYKLLLFIAEMGSFYLIYKLLAVANLRSSRLLIYALNPLIILEIMGNLHFEGFMVFSVLLTFWMLNTKKYIPAGLAIATGVGLKLIPLLFTPIYWAYSKFGKRLFIATALFCILLFLPILFGSSISKFGSSVDLYFGKFEFNASIYYLLRYVGDYFTGYNLIRYIGILPILALAAISIKYMRAKDNLQKGIIPLANAILLCYSLYLFTTTTVHPWYLSILIVCSVFSSFRYAIIWSGMIILSYSHYDHGAFEEQYGLIALEYLLVFGVLFYEYWVQKKRFINS